LLHLRHDAEACIATYQVPIGDTHELRQRLVETRAEFQHSIMDDSINERRKTLEACIRADDGKLPHSTTGSFHSDQCYTTQLAFSEPPTYGEKEYTFHQTNEFCIS